MKCGKYSRRVRGAVMNTVKSICLGVGRVVLGAVLLLTAYIYFLIGPGYYRELRSIEQRLMQIDQVSTCQVDGVADFGLDHFSARVELEGGGSIEFRELLPKHFVYTDQLFIDSVGGYRPFVMSEPDLQQLMRVNESTGSYSPTYGIITNVGPSSPAASILEISARSVQEFISCYASIAEKLSTWPHFPEKGTFRTKDGSLYHYWVEGNSEGNGTRD